MIRSFLAGVLALQLAAGQQQPPVPQAPGQQPQPTTRQTVEAPPPPIARQKGSEPAKGTANTSPLPGPEQPSLPLNTAIAPEKPQKNVIVRPYLPVQVPPIRTDNAPRVGSLVRAGALYLTLQDAIAIALENNIDVEVARYGPIVANWRVTRAEAGGALPGVPSNASQAGSVAAGQGVTGSQAAAGVSAPGSGRSNQNTANATIQQIGPVTQNLDPIIQESSTFSHVSNPQANAVQSLTLNLVSDTRAHTAAFQQGLITGGLVTVQYNQNYLNQNSPTNILNPSDAANLQVSVQHNLLQGFGIAVNARTIRVAKANLGIADLTFRTQVITVVNQVVGAYYGLATSYEQLRADQNAAEVADTFLANVRRQIELGSVAPPEELNAESQAVNTRQQLIQTETTLREQEVRLKNLLSRKGPDAALLHAVRIVPVDRATVPEKDEVPAMEEMVREALATRSDLAVQLANEINSEINALGTKNGLLPTLVAFAGTQQSGIAGTAHFIDQGPGQPPLGPDPYFIGGIGDALGQVFRRNFPTNRAGAFFAVTLNNRQAQADSAIDQLQLQQTALNITKEESQVQVDLLNSLIGMQQARARYASAQRSVKLQDDLYAAESKRFQLGASTPYNVIQAQRDLISARLTMAQAVVAYTNAKVGLDQVLGRTLEVNKVILPEVVQGTVSRQSVPVEPPAAEVK
jgi:outer membrane protein TolC